MMLNLRSIIFKFEAFLNKKKGCNVEAQFADQDFDLQKESPKERNLQMQSVLDLEAILECPSQNRILEAF